MHAHCETQNDAPAFAAAVARARAHVLAGGVVVAPTETFYGLVARANDAQAVARVLACKGRAPDKALPLVVADAEACARTCLISAPMARLMGAFWPGPLTLVLPARGPWPAPCCGKDASGNATLAVRASSHPFLGALARAVGEPLTATSANVGGAPAVCTLAQVQLLADDGLLGVDGGTTPGGLPSTLLAEGPTGPVVVRAGAVDEKLVRRVWG